MWKALKQRKNNVKKDKNIKVDENINNKVIKMKRFLITINVSGGSSGPLRFLVNHNDLIFEVIRSALKLYAPQQRLPFLGSDPNCFILHCSNLDFQVVNPWERIGCYYRTRSFILVRKHENGDDEKTKKKIVIATQNQKFGRYFS